MKNDKLKLRASVVFLLFCTFYAIIAFNLYFIQVQHAHFYAQLGSQQYHVTLTKSSPRAPIYDRSGKLLAMNQDCTSAFILPRQLQAPEDLALFLDAHFPRAQKQLKTKKKRRFMYIKRKLSPEQQQLVADYDCADVRLLKEPHRFYPTPAAAPIVGLTNIDNNGLLGIELQCNETLAGKPTTCSLGKDARSGQFHFKKETKIAGKEGTPIHLTIDSDLQFLVHEAVKNSVEQFEAQEGYALVMNPDSGELICMVTYPHFDPNNTNQLNMEQTKNKVITEAYELGSVIKVFAALAALEEEVVTPDELIDCKNTKTTHIDGRRINTVEEAGIIPFTDVVALSNNIGIAIVAKRLDTILYDHYLRMGFGQKTKIDFPGEQAGFVNPPWDWSKQSIISLSYGYEISATLLQLACAFSMIANGGHKVRPHLILSKNNESQEKSKQLYSSKNIDTIKDILEHTTQHGTARRAQINGYRVMSKTGTANMLVKGKYRGDKNLFTCVGIVQKGDYQQVIACFVKQAKRRRLFASQVAAPLFERIAQHVLIHDKVI